MSLLSYTQLAWEVITTHKLRSFLALTGVCIAVAAVVGLGAVSTGSRDTVVKQLTAYGANEFQVWYGRPERGSLTETLLISPSDVEFLLRNVDRVIKAIPQVIIRVPFKTREHNGVWNVFGVGPDTLASMGLRVISGRFLEADDARDNVTVIGAPVATELFGNEDPIGQTIYLDSRSFLVIGVVGRPSGLASSIAPADYVFIPITTAQRLSGTQAFAVVTFRVDDSAAVPQARETAENLLASRHPGFTFRTYIVEHDADDIKQVFDILTKVILAVTTIALVVGGIGVTNIMLVSVTERTREIGIRKALGATKWNVLNQFLVEAIVICVAGGTLGLFSAWLLVLGMGRFWFHFDLRLPAEAIIWAVTVSIGTGLVTGVYPAVRAASMDPAVALRWE